VIVMLAGTPGGPQDWARAGFAAQTADAYATDHHGLAPILAFVDQNGSVTADTECVDGPAGEAEAFLAVDVPHYLSGLLHVPLNPGKWGIGGFSEGGTCAFELAVRHPDVYGTFLDIAGDRAPNLGSDAQTLEKLYGGDREAMAAHDPTTLLHAHRFEGVTGWFLAGGSDSGHVTVAHRLAGAASAAGIAVTERILPGIHNWSFGAAAFRAVISALAAHLGGWPMAPPGNGTGRGAQTA
jgi:S-formylglutathione hydrolase FrmB